MSTSLGRKVANSAIALSLVFGLAACGEADFDINRKPELVDLLTDRAVATCSMQKSQLDQAPYQSRLKEVLQETNSETLDYFKDNNITICLDKRLVNQEVGFFDRQAQGVYYPSEKILSLWDNGMAESSAGIFDKTASDYGARFLNKFPGSFGGYFSDYQKLEQVNAPMAAIRSGGKAKSYKWLDAAEENVFINTPALRTPPVLTP